MGAWHASVQRTGRDDFKLAVSDTFSMKGLSTMQKEIKNEDLFSFLKQPARPPSK